MIDPVPSLEFVTFVTNVPDSLHTLSKDLKEKD
jgi:hypothetical protein